MMKQWIIGDPHFFCTELTPQDTGLIIACDGLWDVVNDQAAVDMLKEETGDAATAAKKLLIAGLKGGSTDNLSVIVVYL